MRPRRVGSQFRQPVRLLGVARVLVSVGSPAKLEAAQAYGYDQVVVRNQLTI